MIQTLQMMITLQQKNPRARMQEAKKGVLTPLKIVRKKRISSRLSKLTAKTTLMIVPMMMMTTMAEMTIIVVMMIMMMTIMMPVSMKMT